ncbi:sensor histidine kinase [Actinoplanes sp. Pm04-4]|uniref:Sensor histidine kinase n=1 Tax=Paractinoplanes pyxinae TaxID=2997416 RepID=A0ABT4BGL6_9ACTN|nr:sensor histidine kinase [Actinoplanes pyxinae]MCY1145654.1 sensor histidine kinase [Actinoplanes pyxinae]
MDRWPPPQAGRPAAVLAAVVLLGVAVVAMSPWPLAAASWLLLTAWRWPLRATIYYPVLLVLMTAAVTFTPYAMFASWVLALHAFVLFGPRAAFAWSVVSAVSITFAQSGTLDVSSSISLLAPLVAAGWYLSAALKENLSLREKLIERATSDGVRAERTRMAREIHDTIAQDLSASAALLEGAVTDGVSDPRVAQARDLARSGLAEARRSVLALGPGSLDGSGLAGALRGLVTSWSARTGVRGSFASDPEARPLDDDTEAALFRVGQSALANVAEHASATRVDVTLSYLDDEVVLDIRDDGVGFTAAPGAGAGFTAAPGVNFTAAPREGAGLTDAPGEGVDLTAPGKGAGLTDAPREGAGLTDAPGEGVGLTAAPAEGVDLTATGKGVGFAAAPGVGRGFGLAGMRERLGALGGGLEIETGPGAGTAVRAAVPLR